MTPFGMPVVPPVYKKYISSPLRPHGPVTRVVALAAAVSYGIAHSGHADAASSTQIHVLTRGTRERTASHVSVNDP